MPIGPRMSNAVKYAVTREALRDRNEPRRVVVGRLQRIIRDELKDAVPREDTLLKMVSRIRTSAADPSDTPWSMASLNQTNPEPLPGALSTVLETWRYAVATHESFTVRQAKWAARLHGVFREPALTWWWSLRYAFAEKTFPLAGIDFDSSALDSLMVMGPFESEAADLTGFYRGRTYIRGFNRNFPLASDGSPLYELVHLPEFATCPLTPNIHQDAPRQARLFDLVYDLPPLATLGLESESKYIYLRWLTHLYTGPDWPKLAPEEIRDIIVALRSAVAARQSEMPAHLEESRVLHSRPWPFIYPHELLWRVGLPADPLEYEHQADEPSRNIDDRTEEA